MPHLLAAMMLRRPTGALQTTRTGAPPGGSGTMTVGWLAPEADGDGSALSDLANFKVYLGLSSGVYTQDSGLLSSSATSYQFTGLGSATWFARVVAVDSGGNESYLSDIEVSKTIP